MGSIDATTWTALGLTLTVLGLVVSVLVWRRRGAGAGLRAAAWSLLPLAAGLTGVLGLAADVADAVSSWAVRLVFSPSVWLGLVVAGVSASLFVVSGLLRRRTPRPGSPRKTAASPAELPSRTGDAGLDADVEAILKKHGIS
ncbi:MAG: hypothetical protein ACXVWU_12445 [Nocardioides sp.]